jgi:hypothetical protein
VIEHVNLQDSVTHVPKSTCAATVDIEVLMNTVIIDIVVVQEHAWTLVDVLEIGNAP